VSNSPHAPAGGAPLVEHTDTSAGPSIKPAKGQPSSSGVEPPPQCSLLFFWHVVKTAGTTMRTVLQRQAQLGEFEYIYSDTVMKPRWQLIMHQLSQHIAPRRIIVELHSEWGLGASFFADVTQLRAMYEPIGCRVTLGTVLRHPITCPRTVRRRGADRAVR